MVSINHSLFVVGLVDHAKQLILQTAQVVIVGVPTLYYGTKLA